MKNKWSSVVLVVTLQRSMLDVMSAVHIFTQFCEHYDCRAYVAKMGLSFFHSIRSLGASDSLGADDVIDFTFEKKC